MKNFILCMLIVSIILSCAWQSSSTETNIFQVELRNFCQDTVTIALINDDMEIPFELPIEGNEVGGQAVIRNYTVPGGLFHWDAICLGGILDSGTVSITCAKYVVINQNDCSWYNQ